MYCTLYRKHNQLSFSTLKIQNNPQTTKYNRISLRINSKFIALLRGVFQWPRRKRGAPRRQAWGDGAQRKVRRTTPLATTTSTMKNEETTSAAPWGMERSGRSERQHLLRTPRQQKRTTTLSTKKRMTSKSKTCQSSSGVFWFRPGGRSYSFLIQMFLKLIGALGSPWAWSLTGPSPCGAMVGWPMNWVVPLIVVLFWTSTPFISTVTLGGYR